MRTIALLPLFCLLALTVQLFGATLAFAKDVLPVREFTINGVTLVVIEDSRAAIRPAIFPGIESKPEQLALIEGQSNPCYVFVLKAGGKTVLVDTGWGTEGKRKGRTVELLVQSGINPADIKEILITHMHIDHISGLIEKSQPVFPNATLYIAKPEFDYWVTKGADKVPDSVALARAVAKAYEGRISQFDFGQAILPGIVAESAVGHTPGHTMFTVAAGDTSITLIGDMIHAGALQYRYPEISPSFDVNPELAATTRRNVLERISARNGIMAGGHIWEVGRVQKNPEGGGYAVSPIAAEK